MPQKSSEEDCSHGAKFHLLTDQKLQFNSVFLRDQVDAYFW